jgi:hypothetical protein
MTNGTPRGYDAEMTDESRLINARAFGPGNFIGSIRITPFRGLRRCNPVLERVDAIAG